VLVGSIYCLWFFAVFDVSPLTLYINCSLLYLLVNISWNWLCYFVCVWPDSKATCATRWSWPKNGCSSVFATDDFLSLLIRPPERLRSIVMSTSVCVCVSVCVSVCPREYLQNHIRSLPFFVHVPMVVAGSILFRRHCDTLCTSGCVDYMMFLFYNGSYSERSL